MSRYGLMCWRCRGFYQRLRQVAGAWLCNYCAFKARAYGTRKLANATPIPSSPASIGPNWTPNDPSTIRMTPTGSTMG